FSKRELPQEAIEVLVKAACMAPSAGNLQPWEFIAVRNPETKRRLADAAYGQSFIAEAPLVFLVCAVPGRSSWRYGKRGSDLYCIQDTAAAIENLLLTATANGLGGCWVGAFDEERAAKAVGAPEGVRPISIIPIGYPAETPSAPPRRAVSEVLHLERY
ncbi:MAG: nitroreductase family protein, partial [Candidatus Bathyarchaeia archaeon]